jgi:hypothetical protein
MKRTTHEPTPAFWSYARNYLHDFLPNVREMAPRSIEAYRISLESYVHYLSLRSRSATRTSVLITSTGKSSRTGWYGCDKPRDTSRQPSACA